MRTTIPCFRTERAAKEYLIERIATEAQREGVALTEIERNMLFFSETGWTLPNMLEVNAEFERVCDNNEYERMIAELVRKVEKQNEAAGGDEQSKWDDAVAKLSEGDHYLLTLIDLGRSSPVGKFSKWLPARNFYGTGKVRPSGDFFRLIIAALAMLLVSFLAVWIKDKLSN